MATSTCARVVGATEAQGDIGNHCDIEGMALSIDGAANKSECDGELEAVQGVVESGADSSVFECEGYGALDAAQVYCASGADKGDFHPGEGYGAQGTAHVFVEGGTGGGDSHKSEGCGELEAAQGFVESGADGRDFQREPRRECDRRRRGRGPLRDQERSPEAE